MKIVSQLNDSGYFVCTTVADESPLEPGVYLFPALTVDAEPPVIPDGQLARWNDGWVFESPPEPEPAPEPPELTYAQKRRGAYPPMFDYLDGIVKGDAVQVSKYIADCLAVKALYPKPSVST